MKLRARLIDLPEGVDRRGTERRVLRFDFAISAGDKGIEASAHDLSTTGLRIETDGILAVGDELLVELPDIPPIEARVVWQDGRMYGCEFLSDIPKRTIGAVVMQSPFDTPSPYPSDRVEEVELGVNVDVDTLAQWYMDFKKRRASSGEQLIGFRKTRDRIIALISRLN